MARTKKYQDLLIESLKDQKEALGSLNAILEEIMNGEEDAPQLLLNAIRNVAQAHGGISELAEKTGLGRESLYKTLSSKGNQKLTTLTNITQALGFELKFTLSVASKK